MLALHFFVLVESRVVPASPSGSDKSRKELEIEERVLDITLRQVVLRLLGSG